MLLNAGAEHAGGQGVDYLPRFAETRAEAPQKQDVVARVVSPPSLNQWILLLVLTRDGSPAQDGARETQAGRDAV